VPHRVSVVAGETVVKELRLVKAARLHGALEILPAPADTKTAGAVFGHLPGSAVDPTILNGIVMELSRDGEVYRQVIQVAKAPTNGNGTNGNGNGNGTNGNGTNGNGNGTNGNGFVKANGNGANGNGTNGNGTNGNGSNGNGFVKVNGNGNGTNGNGTNGNGNGNGNNAMFRFDQLLPGPWLLTVHRNGLPDTYEIETPSQTVNLVSGEMAFITINVVPKERRVQFIENNNGAVLSAPVPENKNGNGNGNGSNGNGNGNGFVKLNGNGNGK
jgi:hypothetical protein